MTSDTVKKYCAAHAAIADDLASLATLKTSTTEQLAKLEGSFDFQKRSGLAVIAESRVVRDLLPARIEQREADLAQAEVEVMTATNAFISATLGPRRRVLEDRIRESVRRELAAHFRAPEELNLAVDRSAKVVEVLEIWATLDNRPLGGAIKFAERMLGYELQIEKLEKTIRSEAVPA